MLGLGFNSTAVISGGGAAAFDPVTSLSGVKVVADFFDDTSWYNGYHTGTPSLCRMALRNVADTNNIGYVINKAGMASHDTWANLKPAAMFTNTFDSATGWTLGANWSISGGALVGSGSGGASEATYAVTGLTSGNWYIVEIDASSVVGGQFGATLGASAGTPLYGALGGDGTYYGVMQANGTSELAISCPASDYQGNITEVRIYEVGDANSVLASGITARPSAQTTAGIRHLAFSATGLSTWGDDLTLTGEGNIAALYKASAGSQGTYATLCHWGRPNASPAHNMNIMGHSVAGVWDASLWVDDPLTQEYRRSSTSSALEQFAIHVDELTDNDWAVFDNGTQTSTGALSNTYVLNGSDGRVTIGYSGARSTTFDWIGDIYSVIVYDGPEQASNVFDWQNSNTGSQL